MLSWRRPRGGTVRTAEFAVPHDTASASAIRATLRCATTSASNAQPRARRDSLARGSAAARDVRAPDMTAAGALVAPDRGLQHRRTPPERLVSQPSDQRSARNAFAPTPTTPLVGCAGPTGQDRPLRLEPLPDHHQAGPRRARRETSRPSSATDRRARSATRSNARSANHPCTTGDDRTRRDRACPRPAAALSSPLVMSRIATEVWEDLKLSPRGGRWLSGKGRWL